jgi:hypothetical protein
MASRLPRLTALILGLSLAGSALSAQETGDSAVAGRSVTGETLRRAGATRLGDVFRLAGMWDVATVDGFTWQASPLGGGPFAPAGWRVLVDGRGMELNLFGTTSLDRLGIPLDQIDWVELIELPRLAAGRLTTEGIVHVHTLEPASGPSASGWFTTGSEIGDPGPFEFTPQASANVDRTGHEGTAALGYGGGSWFALATLASGQMVPTDPAIVERYAAALGGRPRLYLTAPAFRGGVRAGGGRHEVTVRHSTVGGALGLSPFGTEIATRERLTRAGAAGAAPAGKGRAVSYDVAHTVNGARTRRPVLGPPLDWTARTTEARLQLSQEDSRLRIAGILMRRLAAESPGPLPAVGLATVYTEVGIRPGVSGGPVAAAALTLGEGEAGLAALLRRRWGSSPGSSLEAVLAYHRTVRAEDNSIWAWTERGYGLLPDAGEPFDVVGTRRGQERMTADALWSFRPLESVRVSARGLIRRSRDLSLEARRLDFVPDMDSFEGPSTIVHGAGGELAGGGVEIAATALRGLDLHLAWWSRVVVGGDSMFRSVWESVPRHGARALVEYVPVPGLEIWMLAGYRGNSRWADFDAVAAESEGRYPDRLGETLTLDLAVQKWLWNRRLRAHVGVRNLLGATLRYHPAGATFAPTAMVQLEARLP